MRLATWEFDIDPVDMFHFTTGDFKKYNENPVAAGSVATGVWAVVWKNNDYISVIELYVCKLYLI